MTRNVRKSGRLGRLLSLASIAVCVLIALSSTTNLMVEAAADSSSAKLQPVAPIMADDAVNAAAAAADAKAINKESGDEKADAAEIKNQQQQQQQQLPSLSTANVGFIHAFFASISVIVVSEIGDKTFFIAAIMAMKHPRVTVYLGAMGALGLMTLLSAMLGNILTKVIPKVYTYYLSSFLFALFGLKMLREGLQMSRDETGDEYEEANLTLRESEEKNASVNGKDLETGRDAGGAHSTTTNSFLFITRRCVIMSRKYISAVFLQALVLTFLAEWGDRSQISTIILGARENMVGTVLGGTLGHGICTGMAVVGGRMVAQRISVRTVTLAGAFVFIFFAFSAFFVDPEAL